MSTQIKRVIKNYQNIEQRHIDLIAAAFPEGFSDDDLQLLTLPTGKYLRALEVRTADTVYLFRIDSEMMEVLEEATDDDFTMDVDSDLPEGGEE